MEPIKRILERFEQIASIPRPTKHEQKISAWLQQWAADHHFISQSDSAGNLVIRIPASPGYESRPTVVLQGHMDMVGEKTTDSAHDFLRDPIRCIREGDWLHADKTTLGADNGVAIAIALALAEDKNASYPPLELLFTVEEEVGIGGASHLDPALISGKILINLDSEEEGNFVVGCAGGNTIYIELPVSRELPTKHHKRFRLMVSGLQGGHSGVDIHKHRGNANKILARTLDRILQRVPIQISEMKGGSAHNAIPRQAEAAFVCPEEMSDVCGTQLVSLEKELREEYPTSEPDLRLLITSEADVDNGKVAGLAQTGKIVQLLMALPHGVAEMSASIEGFVETSNNLAVVELVDGALHVTSSQRSASMSRLDELDRRIEAIARLAGAQVTHMDGYPAWQLNMDSSLLQKSVRVYQERFGQRPEVKIIHAGLECGIIGERCGDMDMISLGPTIKNAHSPNEMLYIPSVGRVWSLLISLLDTF